LLLFHCIHAVHRLLKVWLSHLTTIYNISMINWISSEMLNEQTLGMKHINHLGISCTPENIRHHWNLLSRAVNFIKLKLLLMWLQVSVSNEVFQHLGQPRFMLYPTQYCAAGHS
jgi:hypothetical protein